MIWQNTRFHKFGLKSDNQGRRKTLIGVANKHRLYKFENVNTPEELYEETRLLHKGINLVMANNKAKSLLLRKVYNTSCATSHMGQEH